MINKKKSSNKPFLIRPFSQRGAFFVLPRRAWLSPSQLLRTKAAVPLRLPHRSPRRCQRQRAYGNPESPARTLLATVSLILSQGLRWARKENKIVLPIGSKTTAYVGAPSEPPPDLRPPGEDAPRKATNSAHCLQWLIYILHKGPSSFKRMF